MINSSYRNFEDLTSHTVDSDIPNVRCVVIRMLLTDAGINSLRKLEEYLKAMKDKEVSSD